MTTTRFISEPITPLGATFDPARMAVGEPGLPAEFRWRDQPVRVTAVLRTWRDTGPCRHGSGERYVRKHWYEVATARDSGRSVNRLILATLEKSLLPTRHQPEELLARIRPRRATLKVRLTLKDLQTAVDEGRP